MGGERNQSGSEDMNGCVPIVCSPNPSKTFIVTESELKMVMDYSPFGPFRKGTHHIQP